MRLESCYFGNDIVHIIQQHAFGQFQLEGQRISPGAIQRRQHPFHKIRLPELPRTDVDRKRNSGRFLPKRPCCKLRAGGLYNPISQRQYQPGFLGQGYELAGRQ